MHATSIRRSGREKGWEKRKTRRLKKRPNVKADQPVSIHQDKQRTGAEGPTPLTLRVAYLPRIFYFRLLAVSLSLYLLLQFLSKFLHSCFFL